MCPICSTKVLFKRMVDRENSKKRWIISNLTRHVKKHSEAKNDSTRNSEQNNHFQRFSSNENGVTNFISDDNFQNQVSLRQPNFETSNQHSDNIPTTAMGHAFTILSSVNNSVNNVAGE